MKTSMMHSSPVSVKLMDGSYVETAEATWKSLYKAGAMAALVMAVFIPIQTIIFIVSPPPSTVIGWFALFQRNNLLGLLDMDLLLIVDQVLMGLIVLALYVALRRTSPSLMAIGLVANLLGIAAYIASATAFDMLSLSNQYAIAITDAQRSLFLAAGQVMLTTWQGTAFDVGYVLEGIGLLLISVVMLRSTVFGKVTAYIGILLGIMSLLPPTAGTIGLIFALVSLMPLEIWLVLIAIRFLQLGGSTSEKGEM